MTLPDITNLNFNNTILTIKEADKIGADLVVANSADILSGEIVGAVSCAAFTSSITDKSDCGSVNGIIQQFQVYKKMKIYPNPSFSNFSIELNEYDLIRKVQITDLLGKVQYEEQFSSFLLRRSFKFNELKGLSKGVYIITIEGKENLYIGKIKLL